MYNIYPAYNINFRTKFLNDYSLTNPAQTPSIIFFCENNSRERSNSKSKLQKYKNTNNLQKYKLSSVSVKYCYYFLPKNNYIKPGVICNQSCQISIDQAYFVFQLANSHILYPISIYNVSYFALNMDLSPILPFCL